MMDQQSKSPSLRARQLARQEGRVALSADLATAVSLIGSVVILVLYGGRILESSASFMQEHFKTIRVEGSASTQLGENVLPLVSTVAECIVAILAFVIITWMVQTGALFAVQSVSPDVQRANPVKGAQRLWSLNNLVQAILHVVKIAVIVVASYLFVHINIHRIAGLSQVTVSQLASTCGMLLYHFMLTVLSSILLVGVVDYVIRRNRFEQSLLASEDDHRTTVRSVVNDPASSARRRYRRSDGNE